MRNRTRLRLGGCFLARQPNPRRPSVDNAREGKRTLARKHGHLRVLLLSASESERRFGSVLHHQYSKSQLLSVGIFFARSPSENAFGLASVAPWAARFPARVPQILLSVIYSPQKRGKFCQNFLHDGCWQGAKTKKSAGELSFLLSRAASPQRTR